MVLKIIVYIFVDLNDHIEDLLDYGGVRLEALWFIPNIMTASNCFHVTLLVFLRMIAIEKPLQYQEVHKRFRRMAIIIIWATSIIVCSLPLISAPFWNGFHYFARMLTLHACHTLPICFIVIMYVRVVYMLCKSVDNISSGKELSELPENNRLTMQSQKKQLSRMLAGVVICLVICYTPYLVQWHIDISVDRKTCEISTPWVGNQKKLRK